MNLRNRIFEKISYGSRRKKRLSLFNKDYDKYLCMPEDEFTMEYIETRAKYEYKKIFLTIVCITIIILTVKYPLKFFFNLLLYLDSASSNADTQSIWLLISVLITLTFIVSVVIIYDVNRCFYQLFKKRLFLEEMKIIRLASRKEVSSLENDQLDFELHKINR